MFPLQEVVVRGDLKNVDRGELSNALDGIGGNFFAADLGAVRGRLEQVAWVRRVDARRVWPNRIEVQLEEHVAFARWGDNGLVNTFGEPFAAALAPALQAELPLFAGPAGTEGEVARRYRRFVELLAPLQATPERVVLTPRHAWQLRLSTGMYVELGRDGAERVEQRLERFVAAYPASLGQLGRTRFERVDLRYPNGFALRVSGLKS
jgi:cell division protein FtsQ